MKSEYISIGLIALVVLLISSYVSIVLGFIMIGIVFHVFYSVSKIQATVAIALLSIFLLALKYGLNVSLNI